MATILLVEDDVSIRNMYTLGLTNAGFTVTPVDNAPDALKWVEAQSFDVILLDMLLGGMSGIDFLESAQLQVRRPEIKVIGFSNIGSDNVRGRANALGVADFLDKAEYDPPKLVGYIHRMLGDAPAAGAASTPPAA